MPVSSLPIISRLDSQSRLHYFAAAMLVYHKGTPIWLLHTGLYDLCKMFQRISEVTKNAQTSNLEE